MGKRKRAVPPELDRQILPLPSADERGLKPVEGPMVTTITIFYDREVNRIVCTEPAGFEKYVEIIGMVMMIPPPVYSLHPGNAGDMIQWHVEMADGQFKETRKQERRKIREAVPQGRSVKV